VAHHSNMGCSVVALYNDARPPLRDCIASCTASSLNRLWLSSCGVRVEVWCQGPAKKQPIAKGEVLVSYIGIKSDHESQLYLTIGGSGPDSQVGRLPSCGPRDSNLENGNRTSWPAAEATKAIIMG
jgi:hypothetical protein